MTQHFLKAGRQIAKQLKKDTGYFGFIGLAPGVVNFNFSAELFIKAIHLIVNQRPANGHHLWNLFKNLPNRVKTKIEKKYLNNKNNKNEELTSYRIIIKKVEANDNDSKQQESTKFNSIKSLLEVHCDAFEKFRYLHEFPSEGGYNYEYNFAEMNAFIDALKSFSKELIHERGKTFVINKV